VIAWIAAYAFAANTILLSFAGPLSPTAGHPEFFDPLGELCLSSDGNQTSAADSSGRSLPVGHGEDHCALCVGTHSVGLPNPVAQPLRLMQSGQVPIPAASPSITHTKTFTGQPRAPPQTA
jgi:hypothetical protein